MCCDPELVEEITSNVFETFSDPTDRQTLHGDDVSVYRGGEGSKRGGATQYDRQAVDEEGGQAEDHQGAQDDSCDRLQGE